MILCDIGNSSYHFSSGEKFYIDEFEPSCISEDVYYINVNVNVQTKLDTLKNWHNIQNKIDYSKYYETMGVDRVVACEAITHGVIIDAGSAITVDVMRDGVFKGGYIYPGVNAMQKCYAQISSKLDMEFNFNIKNLATNTKDALSYGFLKPLHVEVMQHNLPVFITGGDAKKLLHVITDATLINDLIFQGMRKIL